MAHDEPPHQDLRCLQNLLQLFSSLVFKVLMLMHSHMVISQMNIVISQMNMVISHMVISRMNMVDGS